MRLRWSTQSGMPFLLLFLTSGSSFLWSMSAFSACVLCTCTTAATDIAFGNYTPLTNTSNTATGNVSVACGTASIVGVAVSYTIALSAGSSESFAARSMTNGVSTLTYNIYTNNTNTTIWGDGTSGTSMISDSYLLGLGTTTRNYTSYGLLPGHQYSASPGSYLDSIMVTVTY